MSWCWWPLAAWPEAVSGGGGHSDGLRSPQVWGGFGRGKGTPTLAPLAGCREDAHTDKEASSWPCSSAERVAPRGFSL